jgi:hypothetical protein
MTETGSNRPDSSLLIGYHCIFRGDENKPRNLLYFFLKIKLRNEPQNNQEWSYRAYFV